MITLTPPVSVLPIQSSSPAYYPTTTAGSVSILPVAGPSSGFLTSYKPTGSGFSASYSFVEPTPYASSSVSSSDVVRAPSSSYDATPRAYVYSKFR